ncbi:MAG TPA: glycosyltransferase family 39 protein, partial [Blastocatellia bacterium]
MPVKTERLKLTSLITNWLKANLMPHDQAAQKIVPPVRRLKRLSRAQLGVVCAIIFFSAATVRLLRFQDVRGDLDRKGAMLKDLINPYWKEAERILRDGRLLFPLEYPDSGDARLILHPPGYPIALAAIFKASGDYDSLLRCTQLVQIACDCLAAALVFLIAAELLPFAVAVTAGLLVAASPHLSSYSLWLTPDSLAALPVVAAMYLIIRATKRPRIITVIAAGVMLGLSCWLRSNALLLAPFLAAAVAAIIKNEGRWKYAAALAASAMIVISPITIRNWMVFHRFIPLSLGAGITLIEGIADYAKSGRFGMPGFDREVKDKDAEWYGRPEYAENVWTPDGIERDRERFARGLEVVRSNPVWFAGVMSRRAAFMLRYNDSRPYEWPFSTANVDLISAEPPFGHWPADWQGREVVWSKAPGAAVTTGAVLSGRAEVSLGGDPPAIRVAGDDSQFGDQFAYEHIAVEKFTDYVLVFPAALEGGAVAAKVTTTDRRITLASAMIPEQAGEPERVSKKRTKKAQSEGAAPYIDAAGEQPLAMIEIPFASGGRTEARLVISNNGTAPARPAARIGEARLMKVGPTPQTWSRFARAPIRSLQRNLFTTSFMLPLVIAGVCLLALGGRGSALAALLAVPGYYLLAQSAFHTEYRYILAIH